MNDLKLAEIKKRWKESQCESCQGKRTLMLQHALTFVYDDAAELFAYIEELKSKPDHVHILDGQVVIPIL